MESLNTAKLQLLKDIVQDPDYIDWEKYAKESKIWIPTMDNFPSDSESNSNQSDDSSTGGFIPAEPWEYKSLMHRKKEQELQTTQQVVKDLVEYVISPSRSFLSQLISDEHNRVQTCDMEKVIKMLNGEMT